MRAQRSPGIRAALLGLWLAAAVLFPLAAHAAASGARSEPQASEVQQASGARSEAKPSEVQQASGARSEPQASGVPQPAPVKVLVAVLPFQVHSAHPLGYLQSSLAQLLTTRLEASGRVHVLDSVVVSQAMVAHAEGERTEAQLRRLAARVGADWIVEGSLTELAGQYSLDVRVAPARDDLSVRTMVLTAASDNQLLDRIDELASRVLRVVTGTAPLGRVVEVRLLGAETLGPGVKEKLLTKTGEPYDAKTVEEDLRTLRALPGVATVTAATEHGEKGVKVTFRVVPAENLLGASEAGASGGRVAEIRVQGNRRIEADAIRARISTKPGDRYRPAQIAHDVRSVYGLGFFRNVQVLSQPSPRGRILTFQVEENPVVRKITIAGNDHVPSDRIRDALTLSTGSTLDYPQLYDNRERIKALYRAEGYYLATVTYALKKLSGDAVSVDFTVNEGKKLRLRAIHFEGNHYFSDSELRSRLKTKPWHFWSIVTHYLDHSGTYSEPVFEQDLQKIERRYMDAGFLHVDIGDPQVDASPSGIVVTVKIREGDRFRVGTIQVKGDRTVDLAALRRELKLKTGNYFNRSELTDDVDKLTSHYTDRGFYYASVNPETHTNEADKTVDVTFDVKKGPLYFLRRIDISGNTRTNDSVIRREMQVVEGQLYSARALDVSKTRIKRLGYFSDVTFKPQTTDVPDELDLGVKVAEKPTGSLSFGAGFSSTDRLVLSGSLSQGNLFGRGYGVQLSADTGSLTSRYLLSFSDPYVFGSDFSLAGTVYRTDVTYLDFKQRQQGVDLNLGHALDETDRSRGFLRYSFSDQRISQITGTTAAAPILRELLGGDRSTSLFGLSFLSDTRDEQVLPTQGHQIGASLSFAGLGGFAKFARAELRGVWYMRPPSWWWLPLPLHDKATIVFAARSGYALPFNTVSDFTSGLGLVQGSCSANGEVCPLDKISTDVKLPLTERYFLGGLGSYQLRGFKARSVGPRRAIIYDTSGTGKGPFTTVGRDTTGTCALGPGNCNSLSDKKISDFADLSQTDVIGGNKFLTLSTEYRFPISQSLGLVGIVFLDMGNAFDENQTMFDVTNWRYGTGAGVLWFSPFGPLQAFLGFPLNPLPVEDKTVFEFSVGGSTL